MCNKEEVRLHPYAAFGHLMTGYSAGYYGYLFSQSYASNIYHKMFTDKCVLDGELGMRYRRMLLEVGSSVDSVEQLAKFLGEEPSSRYFISEFE